MEGCMYELMLSAISRNCWDELAPEKSATTLHHIYIHIRIGDSEVHRVTVINPPNGILSSRTSGASFSLPLLLTLFFRFLFVLFFFSSLISFCPTLYTFEVPRMEKTTLTTYFYVDEIVHNIYVLDHKNEEKH